MKPQYVEWMCLCGAFGIVNVLHVKEVHSHEFCNTDIPRQIVTVELDGVNESA